MLRLGYLAACITFAAWILAVVAFAQAVLPRKPPQSITSPPPMRTPEDDKPVSPECVDHNGPAPFGFKWHQIALKNTRLATATEPEVITTNVKVRSAVRVQARRPSNTFAAPVTIRLFVRKVGEPDYRMACAIEHAVIGKNKNATAITKGLEAETTYDVRVELFDYGSGGPTGDSPYTVELVIESTSPVVETTSLRRLPLPGGGVSEARAPRVKL
jgi:hypothetical protein